MIKNNTRRGKTQKTVNEKRNISELVSGSSTHSVANQALQRPALKMSKQVRQLSYFTPFGFTLIELLVTVLIIAILAAVAIPQYQKAVKKSRGAEALSAAKSLHQALAAYQLETGGGILDARVDTLGITPPELKDFQYCSLSSTCNNVLEQVISGRVYPMQIGSEFYVKSPENIKIMLVTCDVRNPRLNPPHVIPLLYCDDSSATDNASCEDYFNCQRENPRGWTVQVASDGSEYKYFASGGKCFL